MKEESADIRHAALGRGAHRRGHRLPGAPQAEGGGLVARARGVGERAQRLDRRREARRGGVGGGEIEAGSGLGEGPGQGVGAALEGRPVRVDSRRGNIRTFVHRDRRVSQGQAFMAFHWREAPANLLTGPAFDPLSKIPEFKVSAVKLEPSEGLELDST